MACQDINKISSVIDVLAQKGVIDVLAFVKKYQRKIRFYAMSGVSFLLLLFAKLIMVFLLGYLTDR